MTIRSRLPKILQASHKISTNFANFKNRKTYGLRGSDKATNYEVAAYWTRTQTADIKHLAVSCECNKITALGLKDCQGNSKTICYHCLASLIAGAREAGKDLTLFDTFTDAFRYSNFGGELIQIISKQSGTEAWAVLKEKRVNGKQEFKDRVELLRGLVEEGID